MARVVKAPEERRSEFIVAAQSLFYTKGYESTSVNDLITAVGVSKGAFYHYFDSKQAVLEALVDDMLSDYRQLVGGLVTDPKLDAISKWNRLLEITNNWKIEQKEGLLSFTKIINMEENLTLKHKLKTKSIKLLVVDYAAIIEQGINEGVFDVESPVVVAELVVTVLQAFSEGLTDLLLNQEGYEQPLQCAITKLRTTQASVERILGAPAGSLLLIEPETLSAWFE
ncbi:TetR/AcrR family transcriptional regulator [Photobacterium sp. SDRW27]|uniref:TetR/AcrR family transcriptional regulator n=1 Tax=Photobacterium obscurum TaxID=2829490 RepID=UPI002242CBB3|nr:TetR/AcrR family transcriptional regulator [Photobacterium obscurum]MCW8330783.1 TetR/AcrR family transcriptional regulator [Photobacterium obscurum]